MMQAQNMAQLMRQDRAEEEDAGQIGIDGEPFTVTGDGLFARALQHEIEHLEGRVFIMNLSPLKRELTKRQIRKRIKAGLEPEDPAPVAYAPLEVEKPPEPPPVEVERRPV